MTLPGVRSTRSIRTRATLSALLVAGVSVAVVFGLFYVAWTRYTLSVRTAELKGRARIIASGLDAGGLPGGAGDVDGARERLLRVEAGLIGARLSVTDAEGRVLYATSEDASLGTYPVRELERDAASGGVLSSGVRSLAGVGTVLVVAAELDIPDRYLVAAEPVKEINQAQAGALGLLALSALAAVAVAWATGAWSARRITAPLVRLTAGARAIAAGDWGHQVEVEGDDEVADLAGAFNDMSARVSAAYGAQREFVADVSHELRTPITSIQGFSGALLDGTITDEPGRLRAATAIREEAERVSGLTRTLLSLAELDTDDVHFAREKVDVAAMATALAERFAERAAREGLDLELGPLGGAPLADDERLLQAVSTLVDNALSYTPAGGTVRLTSDSDGGAWVLAVEDSGPGIAVEDRERVFGRLTRLDPSRSTAAGGSGLGLAICRRLVERMGGTVRIEDSDLGGSSFVVRLPSGG